MPAYTIAIQQPSLFHTVVGFAGELARAPFDAAVRRRLRPLGRITRWTLPARDASIDLLDREHRQLMARAWGGRSNAEVAIMDVFEHLTRQLEILDAPPAVVGLARRAIDDERRHIEINRRVASAYAGRMLPAPPLRKIHLPVYRGASRRLQALLRLINECCLNETTACAYARLSLSIARAPLVRAALREILADEIDHGRVGWAALAAASPRLRAAAAEWLPELLDTHRAVWRGAIVEWPAALRVHGMPPRGTALRLVDRTLKDVILPGFLALGMRV